MSTPQGRDSTYPPVREGWEISPHAVRELMRHHADDLMLIDCRTEKERQIASIAGAVHIPMSEIGSHLMELERRDPPHVIVHCHHGVRSLQVVEFLRRHGVEQALSMAGGIERWSSEVDPAVPRY